MEVSTYFKYSLAVMIVAGSFVLTIMDKIDPNLWIGAILPLAGVAVNNRTQKK